MRYLILSLLLVFGFFSLPDRGHAEEKEKTGIVKKTLKMATTTSVENTGLIYALLPQFEEMFNTKVEVTAVGSGKALKLGEKGDVDIVLVHSPEAENKFIDNGYGVNRREVMYNDFVIVGPADDPAGIKGDSAPNALNKIADKKYPFTSRGDESGTHSKEKEIWTIARIKPEGSWYIETGEGMATTLQIADEKKAYCLVDRGTYSVNDDKVELVILSEGDSMLHNPYSIIAVNPALHSDVNYIYAMAFIGWITSPEGQMIIGEFKKDGRVLFTPSSIKQGSE